MSDRNALSSKQPRQSENPSAAHSNRLLSYSKGLDHQQVSLAATDTFGKADHDSKSNTDSSSIVSRSTDSSASISSYGRFEDPVGRRRSSRLVTTSSSHPTTSSSSNSSQAAKKSARTDNLSSSNSSQSTGSSLPDSSGAAAAAAKALGKRSSRSERRSLKRSIAEQKAERASSRGSFSTAASNTSDSEVAPRISKSERNTKHKSGSTRRPKRLKSLSESPAEPILSVALSQADSIPTSPASEAAPTAKVASKSVPPSNGSSSTTNPNSVSSRTKPVSSLAAAPTVKLSQDAGQSGGTQSTAARKGSSSSTATASGIVDSIASRLRARRREHQAEPAFLEAEVDQDKDATGDAPLKSSSNNKVKSVTTTTSRLKISGGLSALGSSSAAHQSSAAPVGPTSTARVSISSRLRNTRFSGSSKPTTAADIKSDSNSARSLATATDKTSSTSASTSSSRRSKAAPASASASLASQPKTSSRSTTRLQKTDHSTTSSKKHQMSDKHGGGGSLTTNNSTTDAAKSTNATAKNGQTATNGASVTGASATAGSAGDNSSAAAQSVASLAYQHLPMFAELGELAGANVDEAEMTRLQAMLEQRGFPPHIFGSLGSRFQQLIGRVNSNNGSKVQNLLNALKSRDDSQAIAAISELNQILVMGNEDTLAGFPVKTTVTALQEILSSSNFDLMNNACRALNYLIEALPRSISVVALAIPQLIQKLLVIDCIDVAETALTTLEQLSRRHGKQIVQANGIQACLNYIDFFGVVPQRNALAIVANCCNTLTSTDFQYIQPVVPMLSARVRTEDKRSVECVVATLGKLVDTFKGQPEIVQELASYGLLDNIQHLLVVSPPLVGSTSFVIAIKILTQVCAACPDMAIHLLKSHIDDTLCFLLTGSADWAATLIQQQQQQNAEFAAGGGGGGTPNSAHKSAAAAILSKRRSNSFVRMDSAGSFGSAGKRVRSGASFSGMGAFGSAGGGGGGMASGGSNGALPDLLTSRNPQEIYELILLIVELIPKLPEHGEELFEVNSLLRRRSSEGGDVKQHVWEWEDDDGIYHPYNADDARLIEASFNAGAEEANLAIDDRRYSIEFTPSMQQLNEESGTTRNVRRRELPKRSSNVVSSLSISMQSSSTNGAAANKSSSEDTAKKSAVQIGNTDADTAPTDDLRAKDTEYMCLCQEFIVKVFPVVYAVYGSSAGVVIKQKCLQGMLKMVYYCCWAGTNISGSKASTDVTKTTPAGKSKEFLEAGRRRLDQLLDRHDISSHIAALLASSELKLIIGGFQLASILMYVLPAKYASLFRREGVLYQMEQLAQEKAPMFAALPPPQPLLPTTAANVAGKVPASSALEAPGISLLATSVPAASSSGDSAKLMSNLLEASTPPSHASAAESSATGTVSGLKRPTLRLPSFMSPSSSLAKTATPEVKGVSTASATTGGGSSSSRRKSSTKTSTGALADSSTSSATAGFTSRSAMLSDALAAAASRQRMLPPAAPSSSTSSPAQHTMQQLIAEEESTHVAAAFSAGNRYQGTSNRDQNMAMALTSASSVAAAAALEQQYQQYRYQALATAAAAASSSPFQIAAGQQATTAASLGLSQSAPPTQNNGAIGSGRDAYALLRQLTADRYNLAAAAAASGSTAAAAGGHRPLPPHYAGRSVDAGVNEMRQWRLNREEARQWLRTHAQEFCAKYAASSPAAVQRRSSIKDFADDVVADAAGESNPISTVSVETTLQNVFQALQTSTGKHEDALRQLSGILLQGDASPFEIIQSGMVKSLLRFLTDNNWPSSTASGGSFSASQYMRHRHRLHSGNKSPFSSADTTVLARRSRLISFCHVFMDMPSEEQVRSGFVDTMDFIVDPDQVDGFQHLVQKLNSCLTHLEQLPVKVNDAGGSLMGYTRQSSIMRFLNQQQIKCQLQRHPSAGAAVKAYRLGHQVRVDPLAPVQSIVQFLTDRGFADNAPSATADDSGTGKHSSSTSATAVASATGATSGAEAAVSSSSLRREQRKAAQTERRRLRALRKEAAAVERKIMRETAKLEAATAATTSSSMSITDDDSEIALIEPSAPMPPAAQQQQSLIDPTLLRNVTVEIDDDDDEDDADDNMDLVADEDAVDVNDVEESGGDASMSDDDDAGATETNEDDDDDDEEGGTGR